MGKKKGTKKKQDEDDDWDALLEAEQQQQQPASTEETAAAATPASQDTTDEPAAATDAAAAFLAAQGLGGDAAAAAAKKKKKKKKKGGGGESAAAPTDEKVSARGKLIQEQLRKQREAEEAANAAAAAEQQRIADEIAAEEAAAAAIAAEKQRKKDVQAERIAQQKRDGTYKTKKQLEKERVAAQRLAQMRAAGMVVPGDSKDGEEDAKPKRIVYDSKKKRGKGGGRGGGGQHNQQQAVAEEKPPEPKESEPEPESAQKPEPPAAAAVPAVSEEEETPDKADGDDSSGDDWDADSDEDSDAEDKFGDLEKRLQQVTAEDEEVDMIEIEKQKEQERLKELGRKRAEAERLEAERVAKIRLDQEEQNLKEAMAAQLREEGKLKRLEQEKANLAARSPDDLRCPIVVIMGHVDTGKTKLLDKIRKTNVQEGEAGGITQQIGATFFEKKTLETQTARLNAVEKFDLKVPGMLVIDTPGHESFTNLRSRGSNLCDVAILVVDLMHGLEQQTIESLNMLRKKGVPFVVALNKVDRCYGWKTKKDTPIREALQDQEDGTMSEFRSRSTEAKVQLAEQGVNSNLYWEMGEDDWRSSDFVPLVPTSAISGEGVQDVLLLLCQMSQYKLVESIMWHANLQCTVLEVKAIDGLGMTVDVLVVNGYLREGDRAMFCTLDGPVVTEIRGLLTPPPSREMRVKSEYIHHKEVKGALGVKVIGNNLDKVMAGTPVMVIRSEDEEEDLKAEVMSDLTKLESKLSTDRLGVLVQASTLGALEALLQFLREDTQPPIPVSAIGIGTIHKRDVTKISIMNEKGHPEYATILAFDVPVEREAREHAQEMGVRVMTAEIIYHLFDQFTSYMKQIEDQRRAEASALAVFPSIIKILPQHVYNQKDPIIFGAEVVEGILKVGTPLCVPALGHLFVGKVDSIESNGRSQETARKGESVAVKIVNEGNPNITYGRQFDATNMLYSQLSRASIDALKAYFKDQLENSDWRLVVKLKKVFGIL